MNVLRASVACALLTLASGVTHAYEAGDIIVRAGATVVAPNDDSSLVKLNGSTLSLGGGNSTLGVNNDTQLGLTLTYMFNDHWGVELLAATPFTHIAKGQGELAGLDVAKSDQLPPTLSAIYYFSSDQALKPYLGAGLNYTVFFNEDLTSEADSTLAGLGLTQGNVTMDSSWGLALQVGADYEINNNWMVNASVRWIDIDTKATIDFAGGNQITADVEIDPWVYTFALGYRF